MTIIDGCKIKIPINSKKKKKTVKILCYIEYLSKNSSSMQKQTNTFISPICFGFALQMVMSNNIINITKNCIKLSFFGSLSTNVLFVYLLYVSFYVHN